MARQVGFYLKSAPPLYGRCVKHNYSTRVNFEYVAAQSDQHVTNPMINPLPIHRTWNRWLTPHNTFNQHNDLEKEVAYPVINHCQRQAAQRSGGKSKNQAAHQNSWIHPALIDMLQGE
jgi:hypothetical protein